MRWESWVKQKKTLISLNKLNILHYIFACMLQIHFFAKEVWLGVVPTLRSIYIYEYANKAHFDHLLWINWVKLRQESFNDRPDHFPLDIRYGVHGCAGHNSHATSSSPWKLKRGQYYWHTETNATHIRKALHIRCAFWQGHPASQSKNGMASPLFNKKMHVSL